MIFRQIYSSYQNIFKNCQNFNLQLQKSDTILSDSWLFREIYAYKYYITIPMKELSSITLQLLIINYISQVEQKL